MMCPTLSPDIDELRALRRLLDGPEGFLADIGRFDRLLKEIDGEIERWETLYAHGVIVDELHSHGGQVHVSRADR